jgi:hypothetical protein
MLSVTWKSRFCAGAKKIFASAAPQNQKVAQKKYKEFDKGKGCYELSKRKMNF